jgi:hypothetical protein
MSIKSWFIGKLKTALREHNEIVHWKDSVHPTLSSSHDTRLRSAGMNFTLYNAQGGWVLEYHTYDNKTDTTENRIHIIQDTEDFGDRLSKILTLELLRR